MVVFCNGFSVGGNSDNVPCFLSFRRVLEYYLHVSRTFCSSIIMFFWRHSTETALVRIHNDMMQSMDCRRGVLLVLLDLSAAFDTLGHGILIKRLHDTRVRHTALEWFKSYLDDRTFTVKIGQTMSARSEVRCGVPPGSVLGPMLFNVYCLPIGDICKAQCPLSHLR